MGVRSRPVDPVCVPSAEDPDGEEGPRLVLGLDSSDCRLGERMGCEADLGVV